MSRHVPRESEGSMMARSEKTRAVSKDAGATPSIGNSATAKLLEESNAGKKIPPHVRARIERSFGVNLSGVRVDDGPAAREHADALNAEALVERGRIHWSSTAPPVESAEAEPLLAHELAHVVQQREASVLENRVSSPGESAEVSARAAAGQAMAGKSASVGKGGAVAGTQRQEKLPSDPKAIADPATATQLLTVYLQKVANTTPPQNIKKAAVVRTQLQRLAFSGGAALMDVNAFVDAATTSSDPATMAKQFVAKVPRITLSALADLASASFIDPQPGIVQRAKDLAEKSSAGGGDTPKPPGYKSQEDQLKELQDKMAAMRGGKVPGGFGPFKVDIFQLGRIIQGAGGVVKPTVTRPAAPQSEDYPSVTAAIAKMPKDALVPAEAKGKGDAGEWAETAEFAADLARVMDVAQKSNQTECTVNLGDNYEHVKDRAALRNAVETIIQQIRDALPHHASGVKYVDVKTGRTLLTRGMAQTQ